MGWESVIFISSSIACATFILRTFHVLTIHSRSLSVSICLLLARGLVLGDAFLLQSLLWAGLCSYVSRALDCSWLVLFLDIRCQLYSLL